MDGDSENEGVYGLITTLCEQFTTNPDKIKKYRAECYEIILGKKIIKYPQKYPDLEGTKDAFCNLLAWQYLLANKYGLREHANKLNECAEETLKLYENDTETFNNILTFLLRLRNVPKRSDNILDLSSLPVLETNNNFNAVFRLPDALLAEAKQFNYGDANFYIKSHNNDSNNEKSGDVLFQDFDSLFQMNSKQKIENNVDLGYESPTKKSEEDIWKLVQNMEYSHRRTWENYGLPDPEKERPFLSELGPLSSLWVENLESLYVNKKISGGVNKKDCCVFRSKLKPKKDLIKDLKFLLVGLASNSFSYNDFGEFSLTPDISIEGITPKTLKIYCENFVFAGTCYKALNSSSFDSGSLQKGYMTKELHEGIQRFLQFYRTAAMSLPDTINLLDFDEKTRKIRYQIITLSRIFKVGPYVDGEAIPHGVALLNYLYQEVLTSTDEDIILVLYSILYACCQVYISRFLTQWLMEGILNDPFGEFFVKPNLKYFYLRERAYWSKCYEINEELVPNFLQTVFLDIVNCGKSMNLLKLCNPSSKLCSYLMGKKPLIFSCCITNNQLSLIKRNTTKYYLEVRQDCLRFDLNRYISSFYEQDPIFMEIIAKKRAATLKRLELERMKKMEEEREKRQEELNSLKEQYDAALEAKQRKLVAEIEKEIREHMDFLEEDKARQKIIEEERSNLIEYYKKLNALADVRKAKAEANLKLLKITLQSFEPAKPTITIEESKSEQTESTSDSTETEKCLTPAAKTNSSTETFHSVEEIIVDENLDVLNANEGVADSSKDENSNTSSNNKEPSQISQSIQNAIDNFALARKIKQKVLNEEMGLNILVSPERETNVTTRFSKLNLTEAQRNKMRVLQSEFDIRTEEVKEKATAKPASAAQINKSKIMGSDRAFYPLLDNENYLNRNEVKKSKSLSLDLKLKHFPEKFDKPVPMSVDSTPMSEFSLTTPTTSIGTNVESGATTADLLNGDKASCSKDGFNFDMKSSFYLPKFKSDDEKAVFSKRMDIKDVDGISSNCLSLFLRESIKIPLTVHSELVNNELLKYFINNVKYLDHLKNLRSYFFLQNGEFGRKITEDLFEKLYDANFPVDLINCRTLHNLVYSALNVTGTKCDESNYLSLKINEIPKVFDLGNPDVLGCISLTYRIEWPLNVLLTPETIAKYDEVFRFLLKLTRMNWVLKKIFLELKVLAKETGKKEIYLMASPQYRFLHQCRHIMTHFIQTLQNYIVGEVIQPSWAIFEKSLESVDKIEEIYREHVVYIKKIIQMCLLRSETATNIIQRVFTVILKFYDYLRLRNWECINGAYEHPNFEKLQKIFSNFKELLKYFFKLVDKGVKVQPHLLQLLDMLNINEYYK